MRKKKVLVIVSVLFFSLGTTLAFSNELRERIGLGEAIHIAQEESYEIEAAEASKDHADLNATLARSILDETYMSPQIKSANDYVTKYKTWRLAEWQGDVARDNQEYVKEKVELETKKMYLDVHVAKETLNKNRALLKTGLETLRQAEVKLKAGVIPRKDFIETEAHVAQARSLVKTAESQYNLALYKLKRQLDLSMSSQLDLADTFTFEKLQTPVNIDAAAEALFEETFTYKKMEMQKEALEEILEEAEDEGYTGTPAYYDVKVSLQELEVNIEKAKKDASFGIYAFFNGLQALEYNIEVLDRQISLAKESQRIAEVSFEAGVAPSSAVDLASDNLLNLEVQKLQKEYEYLIKKEQFERNMFLENFSTAIPN